jgi:signal transduction histidine kinase/DNA-binding response OmpR family regulator
MRETLYQLDLRFEQDVVEARQRARVTALQFDLQDQTRLATASSEIARNAFRYAVDGKVEFLIELETRPQQLTVVISDHGAGIPHLNEILSGRYQSNTGMGMGMVGTKRLMDHFQVNATPSGTRVEMAKHLPRTLVLRPVDVAKIRSELLQKSVGSPYEELQVQNRELIKTLEELKHRQEELARVNKELEDTNRGVVALYAELDERADYLRRASELKTAFLSNMSHEFRTPLNSMLALSNMLLDRTDGDLSAEQDQQVRYIKKSTEDLFEMVNDLLDLAKVEAGKLEVKPKVFSAQELFSALRGMLKPLLADNSALSLVFEDVQHLPEMFNDEAKLSQVLRNLISNALKFTERGEVRVSAQRDGSDVSFRVADTGIGIAKADLPIIFEEFGQIETRLQKLVKGTGLGLPLSRRLAELMGGILAVESEVGVGSTFSVRVPITLGTKPATKFAVPQITGLPVLIVEDNNETRYLLESALRRSEFQPIAASAPVEARAVLDAVRPVAVIMDMILQGEPSGNLIRDLKTSTATRSIPVLAISIHDVERDSISAGADAFARKPVDGNVLLPWLRERTQSRSAHRVLVIDDNEVARFTLRQLLQRSGLHTVEAMNGSEGLAFARQDRPDAIFLDLIMPEMDGFAVIEQLRKERLLADVPVVVYTSKAITQLERSRLLEHARAVLSKSDLAGANGNIVLQSVLLSLGLLLPTVPGSALSS